MENVYLLNVSEYGILTSMVRVLFIYIFHPTTRFYYFTEIIPLPPILNIILDNDLGTIPFIPMFLSLDICSTFCCYFFKKCLKAFNVSIRMIRFAVEFSEYHHFDQRRNNAAASVAAAAGAANDRDPPVDQNTIVCAKHKKSGCEECLANSELVFLT